MTLEELCAKAVAIGLAAWALVGLWIYTDQTQGQRLMFTVAIVGGLVTVLLAKGQKP